ncbi:tape measure protein [Roseomonas gilardii]|uniref:tape measure protein n=1 Tax=Roseomonas gilardii TaxID=257708 RepID=UPI0004829E8C|nr:tape measure protein [Roseomonas gilardii]PZR10375.1 MAG: tape measure domain-containing protein [Azospirillum brasilense]SUE63496.1 Phage-related minor tail protein [Roseomonas gilardii subsp. rosea]
MADATRRVSVRLSLDDAARVKAGLREVGETGQRSLDQIRGGAERASRSLELLDLATRGIQITGVAVAARALVQAGDALTQGLSRLQNATGSVERASSVYEALYRNALSTGVAVSESVDAFQRFSIAAREIGATSDQVVRLVTGLQRVAIVSGASTGEISSATLQLAQALASGVLQGDELRSILEAMPLLAEGLARELGVSIGELRKLGSEGKLTAERVFPALLRATERLGAELDKAPLSLGRAFGQLTASTENFLGQLDRAIGLSNALARALSAAARAVDSVRQGAGLLSEEERFAGMRRQADALAAQIARLESENDGRPSLTAQTRRGSIRPGLVGAAEQQAGVDRTARLEELRRQYAELQAEITRGEQAAGERQRTEQETAATAAAEARRRRATQDVQELTRDLDDRFRINREYEERVRRLREAEAAGGVTAAERTRLETLALQERDEALRRLEPRVAAVRRASNEGAREAREAERELNELLRERERLIQNNETAYERYQRRIATLSSLVERSERAGRPVPEDTVQREAVAAMEELERAERRVEEGASRTSDTVRELGLTFSSAFEDAIVKGEKLSKVMQGLLQDIARIIARKTITEPLGNAVSTGLNSLGASSWMDGIGSWLGGLFRAEGGPVTAGQPYIVGERGPEWFVPDRGGTVLPNGTAPTGASVTTNITIDARGADAGVEVRLRMLSGQIARQASAMTLDAIRRGGAAYKTVRG